MVYRSAFENTIFEFVVPTSSQKGIIMLLNGMPSVPRQTELLESLGRAGYLVVFPRYAGTWESPGVFLAQSPALEIERLCQHILTRRTLTESYAGKTFKVKSKKIVVVGASFGGSVALCLANSSVVKQIIALSPVVDWQTYAGNKTKADMNHHKVFLKKGFGEAYRFKNSGWKKFSSGELFNAPQRLSRNAAKRITIVYDKADTVTAPGPIQSYAKKVGIASKSVKGVGHISFSRYPASKLVHLIK